MTLQASGQISLNDIHVEAGGTTGTACQINDSDIRDLISKGAGVASQFSEWYGASAESITWPTSATTVYSGVISPSAAPDSMIEWQTDGDTRKFDGSGSWNDWNASDWLSNAGSGTGSNYEMKWVEISTSGGPTYIGNMATENTWYDLGTQRQFGIDGGHTSGIISATVDITIRKDSDAGSEVTRRCTFESESAI